MLLFMFDILEVVYTIGYHPAWHCQMDSLQATTVSQLVRTSLQANVSQLHTSIQAKYPIVYTTVSQTNIKQKAETGPVFAVYRIHFAIVMGAGIIYKMEPELAAIRGQSSAHSFATGPDTPEPFISPLLFTITPALSSK